MERSKLRVVDGNALDLDLFEEMIGQHEISVLDEEADGVGISIEFLAEEEASGFALFVNCRPLMRGDWTGDPDTSLRERIEGKRRMGHEAEGHVRFLFGLPAYRTRSRIEDRHEADLMISDGERLFQAHATSMDPDLTCAAIDLLEARLLPQFLVSA